MALTAASAASRVLTTLTPPPLPRPPAWIWALTTTAPLPAEKRALAALSASSIVVAISPLGTGTPYFRRMSFAWYSWIFMVWSRSNVELRGNGSGRGELPANGRTVFGAMIAHADRIPQTFPRGVTVLPGLRRQAAALWTRRGSRSGQGTPGCAIIRQACSCFHCLRPRASDLACCWPCV